jgi:2'-5' RNA ligase
VDLLGGSTAVVVKVPVADPLVHESMSRSDQAAARGIPAHVTLLYPFFDLAQLTAAHVRTLARVCAAEAPFEVTFERFGRFPGVLWLAPEPAEPFRRLTRALAAEFPQVLPYGGAHPDLTPHLTLADADDEQAMREVEAAVAVGLPLRFDVRQVHLLVFDGQRFDTHACLPLGG